MMLDKTYINCNEISKTIGGKLTFEREYFRLKIVQVKLENSTNLFYQDIDVINDVLIPKWKDILCVLI